MVGVWQKSYGSLKIRYVVWCQVAILEEQSAQINIVYILLWYGVSGHTVRERKINALKIKSVVLVYTKTTSHFLLAFRELDDRISVLHCMVMQEIDGLTIRDAV